MRPARFLGLAALGAALIDVPARADEPATAPTKQAASLSALPATTYDTLGATIPVAPSRVAANEKVAGLWITGAHATGPSVAAAGPSKSAKKKKGRKSKPAPVTTAPTRVMATVVSGGPILASMSVASGTFALQVGVSHDGGIPTETCLRTLLTAARVLPDHSAWSNAASPAYLFHDETGPAIHVDNGVVQTDRGAEVVRLVRTERLRTPAAGNATLEIVEAWVDTRTQGAREVQRVTIPLATMLRAPGGVDVYAFRHDQEVSLVVRTPRADEHPNASNELSWRTEDDSGSIQCGHALIPLNARKLGDAETTFVLGEVELPVLPVIAGERETKEIRGFRLALSDAWLGSSTEPLVSTSFGWFGKPRPRPNEP